MAYRIETVAPEEIKKRAGQYPYALIYKMSEVYLGDPAGSEAPWDELLEARYFSEESEMHVFRCEKQWRAVVLTDDEDEGENTLIRKYPLANRFQSAGKYLVVKAYLADDEDGQVYVEQTRLCSIAGGKTDGEPNL